MVKRVGMFFQIITYCLEWTVTVVCYSDRKDFGISQQDHTPIWNMISPVLKYRWTGMHGYTQLNPRLDSTVGMHHAACYHMPMPITTYPESFVVSST